MHARYVWVVGALFVTAGLKQTNYKKQAVTMEWGREYEKCASEAFIHLSVLLLLHYLYHDLARNSPSSHVLIIRRYRTNISLHLPTQELSGPWSSVCESVWVWRSTLLCETLVIPSIPQRWFFFFFFIYLNLFLYCASFFFLLSCVFYISLFTSFFGCVFYSWVALPSKRVYLLSFQ